MKIFSFFMAVIVNFAVVCLECVKIESQYVEGKHYFIREKDNPDNKLLKFQIKVVPNSVQKEKGNLIFGVNLVNMKKVKTGDSINLQDIVIENGVLRNLRIKQSANNTWESDTIRIVIPENELQNTPFTFRTSGQFRFLINNSEKNVDGLYFNVTPTLSISIPDAERKIHFGKIVYDNGMVRSVQKHTFHLIYQCITQAKLFVTSDTDYNLRDKKGNLIPFRMSLLIGGNKEKISRNNCEFSIPSDQNSFENYIEGKCYIKFPTARCPIAGKYKARVTFTIKAG